MKKIKRIVVKVGSNVLTRADGGLNTERIADIALQIAELRRHKIEVILITSGAVASGKNLVAAKRKDAVSRRQLCSAIGQVRLMQSYAEAFKKHDLLVAQILATKDNFANRHRYLNMRNCIEVLLESGVVPVVNENDTVAVTELMFTDNDELSGLIVTMTGGDALYILSNIDGIYNGTPGAPGSEVIREIETGAAGNSVSRFIGTAKSSFGRGGMLTKFNIARKVARSGIPVNIVNGTRDNILVDLIVTGKNIAHSTFLPGKRETGAKKWIGHSQSFAKGKIIVNAGARDALFAEKARSLLLVGVVKVEGEFEKGDIVQIFDEKGKLLGCGKTQHSSDFVARAAGMKVKQPVIHYNYLSLEG